MAGDEGFLSRWSRRKLGAKAPAREEAAADPMPPDRAVPAAPSDSTRSADPRVETPDGREAPGAPAEPAPLPSVESLTPESDFSPFMSREVDGKTRNRALKALFADPHFNTMDMLDVYVDDYSKPDPIPESWLSQLEQLSHLGDRGARDREEEERRRAAARDEARPAAGTGSDPGAATAPPADPGGEAAEPAADPAAEPAADPPGPLAPAGRSDPDNPPFSVGESGT